MAYVINNRVFRTLSEAQEYITESDFAVMPTITEITRPEQIRSILDPTRFAIGPGFDDQDIFKEPGELDPVITSTNTGASRLEDTTGIWQRIFTQMGRSDLLETGGELLQILLETTKAGQPGAPIDESQLRTLTQEQREAALEAYLIFNQSFDRAQEIVDTMIDNPAALEGMEDPGEVTNLIIEQNALGLLGPSAATPVTSVPQGMVIRGGAGVTVDISEIGSISDVNLETIFEHLKGYIPGVSLPSWLPSAGVIFIPDIQGKVRQVNDAIGGVVDSIEGVLTGEASVQDVLDAMGGVITDVFDAVVYNEEEGEEGILESAVSGIFGAIKDVLEGTADATTTGTVVGGVITSVLGSSLPTWLPGVLTTVFGSGSPVLPTIQRVLSEAGIELPLTQEVETDPDPNTLFTNRGNNYFVNSETDEYFQLAESEDIDFEFNGQYTREQLEDTGLETINSGTYQSLLDDLSFHALEEDIYQYSMEDLIERYEAEGGILPGDWKLMDEESQYNFFLDDYFDIPPLIRDPDRDSDEDSDDDPDDDSDDDTDDDTDTSDIADLFSDILEQTEIRILQSIAEAGYATPEDIAAAIEEAGLLTAENLADTLEAAGFATPEDITNALQAAGFATPEDIATALEAANILTPEALATALSEAGFATPEDIATALADSGFATPEDIATALQAAGFATPEDITTALNAAGLLTADDLATALSESGFVTAEDLVTALAEAGFTTPEDIASAISGLATPQDIADALDAAGFATPQDIQDAVAGLATPEDIQEALANFNFTDDQIAQLTAAIPEGLTLDQLNETLAGALEGVATGEELDAVMDAITGLNFATPEDVENALANFNFTDDQLQQIVNALPPGLNITDLNDALATALDGLALGADLDAATDTIVTAINGLNFATAEDVQNALANFGFTDDQLQQIAGVIPEGLTLAELNEALSSSLAGIALGTDLDDATNTIVNAIDGLAFATPEDIRTALSEFNFTQDQLDQIAALIPDTLRSGEVEDLLSTALTGISRQEDVDTAFASLTTNLTEGIRSLEAGQEEILTGQTRIGEDIQSVEELLMASTGLLGALGAGGAAAVPQARPYDPYLEKLSYAPQMVEVERPQPKTDYNKEVDRLLTIGMGGKKPGMLV